MDKNLIIGLLGGFVASNVISQRQSQEIQDYFAARAGGATEVTGMGGWSPYLDILLYNAVYYDKNSAYTVADQFAGTIQKPLNNLADVRTVCASKGVKVVFLLTDATLDADMQNYYFIGFNQGGGLYPINVINNGFDVNYSTFIRCMCTDDCSGPGGGVDYDAIFLQEAVLSDTKWAPMGRNVTISSCTLKAGALLDGVSTVLSGAGAIPTITFECTAATNYFWLHKFTGTAIIAGMSTGTLDIYGAGKLTLNNTNVGGTINIYGPVEVTDNSAGSTVNVFNTRNDDGIYFDSVNGVAGTAYPIGTPQVPSNTIADCITMCAARNTKKIYGVGAVTLGATMEGYTFVGINHDFTITLGGRDVDTSHFYGCTVTGAQGGTGSIYLHDCILNTITGFAGYAYNCTIVGNTASIVPRDSSTSYFLSCNTVDVAVNYATFDLHLLTNVTIYCLDASGYYQVENSTHGGNGVIVAGINAFVISDNSNTAGMIVTTYGASMTKGAGGALETDTGYPARFDSLDALCAATKAGRSQMKAVTCDLHNAAASYDLATCATQEIIVDSLVFSPRVDVSDDVGGITGISVQTDETTPQIFIAQADGVLDYLDQYEQIAWTGAIRVRVGSKIQVTIYGGTADANPTTCDVIITYHAVADGGTL